MEQSDRHFRDHIHAVKDDAEMIALLRNVIDDGNSIEEAIQNVFHPGWGKLLLIGPVAEVTRTNRTDAMRLITQALNVD